MIPFKGHSAAFYISLYSLICIYQHYVFIYKQADCLRNDSKFCKDTADASSPVLKALSLHQFQQNNKRKSVALQANHGRKELFAVIVHNYQARRRKQAMVHSSQ